MENKLTQTQKAILEDIKRIPAKYRVCQRVGGTIPFERLSHFDARSLRGLFSKGYLTTNDFGVVIVDKAK